MILLNAKETYYETYADEIDQKWKETRLRILSTFLAIQVYSQYFGDGRRAPLLNQTQKSL